jgi:hypothetical protein
LNKSLLRVGVPLLGTVIVLVAVYFTSGTFHQFVDRGFELIRGIFCEAAENLQK